MTHESFNSYYRQIFYFLGHLPAQINHALSVIQQLPGECIVTTDEAEKHIQSMGFAAKKLDTVSRPGLRFDFSEIPNTLNYLNQQKGVIFFFDTFTGISKLTSLTKIMLFHGNTIKLRWFRPWRMACLKKFDYMTSLGPFCENVLIKKGVPPEKILQIGQTRCDELMREPAKQENREVVYGLLKSKPKPIVSYMPTWYGANSMQDVGLKIMGHLPEDYLMLFRPHPETPSGILENYSALIKKRKNILFAAEGTYPQLGLVPLLQASDAFIVDMSSVLLDTMLTGKPVLFALGGGLLMQTLQAASYRPVKEIYDHSQKITRSNAAQIHSLLRKALEHPVPAGSLSTVRERFFYHLDGRATEELVRFVKKQLRV